MFCQLRRRAKKPHEENKETKTHEGIKCISYLVCWQWSDSSSVYSYCLSMVVKQKSGHKVCDVFLLKDTFLSNQLLFSSSIRILMVFDLAPWVGDLRRASMNSAHLASLQFLEFGVLTILKAPSASLKVRWAYETLLSPKFAFVFEERVFFLLSVSTLSTRNAFNLWPKKEGPL